MSMIGYSRLMKEIFDVDKTNLKIQMEAITEHKLSGLRMKALKQLSVSEKETISTLLKKMQENHTGGTYKTIKSFFICLEKDKILESKKIGVRSYWKFSEKAKDLENYFKSA